MAKKAAQTQVTSVGATGAAPALKKKAPAAGAPKHVKVAAVAAAVEGFVTAIVNPADAEVRKAPAAVSGPVAHAKPVAEEPLNAVIADQSVAELSRPAEVTYEAVAKLAYQFYLERNGQNGSQAGDWLRAERALHARNK